MIQFDEHIFQGWNHHLGKNGLQMDLSEKRGDHDTGEASSHPPSVLFSCTGDMVDALWYPVELYNISMTYPGNLRVPPNAHPCLPKAYLGDHWIIGWLVLP